MAKIVKSIVAFIAALLLCGPAVANNLNNSQQTDSWNKVLSEQNKVRDNVLETLDSKPSITLTFLNNGYDPFGKPYWYFQGERIVVQIHLNREDTKQILSLTKHALITGADKMPAAGPDNWCDPHYVVAVSSKTGSYDLLACSRTTAFEVYENGKRTIAGLNLGANINDDLQDIVRKELGKKSLPSLPPKIAAIREEIRHKTPDEFRSIIVGHLGEPTKDVGSGVHIEEWDTEGGYLFLHETAGPYFYNEHNKRIWLVDTITLAGNGLFGQYEMVSLPLKSGMNDWLGELKLYKNLSYKFIDSKQFHVPRAKPYDIFFMKYPNGKFKIKYAPGISGKTLLEDVEKGGAVATFTFVSDDEKHRASFDIVSNPEDKELAFRGKSLSFEMHKDW